MRRMRCCVTLDSHSMKAKSDSPNCNGIPRPHCTPPQSRLYVRTNIFGSHKYIHANIKLDSSPSRGSYARYHNGRPPPCNVLPLRFTDISVEFSPFVSKFCSIE